MSDNDIDLEMMNAAFRDYVPHNKALGLTMVGGTYTPATVTLKLPWNEAFIGNPETRVLAGGVVTTLIDAASGAAVYFSLREAVPIATLDLRVDMLRSGEPDRDLFAFAECVRRTHNVAFVRATVRHADGEEPVATAAATFMLSTKGRGITLAEATGAKS